MVSFVAGKPVTTDTPGVLVDAGLPIGRHRFQLVVLDSGGLRSKPDEIVVQVQRLVLPPVGPVIGPVGPVVGPVVGPPVIVRPSVVNPVQPGNPGGPLTPFRPGVTVPPSVVAPPRRTTRRRKP